jgi:predicted ATPase
VDHQGTARRRQVALAAELKTDIQVRGGYLAGGKFDLYRRELPYAGFVSAFDALLQQRLIESSTQLERFKRELLDGLGNLAGAMADLVPDRRLIVATSPAPRASTPSRCGCGSRSRCSASSPPARRRCSSQVCARSAWPPTPSAIRSRRPRRSGCAR